MVDGDKEFARELAATFIETGERDLAAILHALDDNDPAILRSAARSLRSASSSLLAPRATAAVASLEAAVASGTANNMTTLVENLRAEVSTTIRYLRSVI